MRFFFILLLSVASNSAMAGWVKIISDDNYDNRSPCEKNCYFTYIDLSSISKNGDAVKLWRLNDFEKSPTSYSRYKPSSNDKPHLSVTIQNEYDCKARRTRFISASYYSGPMGGGKAVHTESVPGEWYSIGGQSSREGIEAFLWRAVCERQ